VEDGTSTAVTGAALTLYEAGTAYRSGATSLGTATSDGKGNFTISYTPPSPAGELYVVALGGNAGGDNNSAIGLMGLLGSSASAPSSVIINEFTTVAGAWALAQFTDSTGQTIGAPATNATGFTNAANQAQANLADITTGGPAAFWTTYGINAGNCSDSPPVNCDGLERMDTFANILASCVETGSPSSTPCSTLLGDTGSSTTTLGAAHYLATNPGVTTNISDLYALDGGSPFTPTLPAAPDGWELALNLTPSGSGFDVPSGLAIDAAGNAWVTNQTASGSVTELNSSGALVNNYNPAGSNFDLPLGVAIDASGNAWVVNDEGGSDTNGSVTELNSSGALVGSYNNTNTTGANFNGPDWLAIDASGNVWVPNESGTSVTVLASNGTLVSNYNPTGSNFDGPNGIAIDASGNAWVTNSNGNSITKLSSGGALVGNYTPSDSSVPYGIAIDASGNAWVASNGSAFVTELTSAGALVNNYYNIDFDEPYGVAIDSGGNVWVTDESGFLFEVTSAGDVTGSFAPIGANFSAPQGVATDASGNVWVANNSNNSVAEFIGAAGPVLTPLEACLTQASPSAVCLP
jgi:streptogramin lyase